MAFIDESGYEEFPSKPSASRKASLFIEACLLLNDKSMKFLEEKYNELLNMFFPNGFTIRELFQLYEKVSGKPAELKAGYVSNLEGPFIMLRNMSRDKKDEFRDTVFEFIAKTIRDSKCDIIAVVIDKNRLKKLMEKTKKIYDVRLLAMDFLLTRLAWILEKKGFKNAIVIHDNTYRKNDLKYLLEVLKKQGYYYNPRLKKKSRYDLIDDIQFMESHESIYLQFADFTGNIVFKARSGKNKKYYSIIAGSPWFREYIYPHK